MVTENTSYDPENEKMRLLVVKRTRKYVGNLVKDLLPGQGDQVCTVEESDNVNRPMIDSITVVSHIPMVSTLCIFVSVGHRLNMVVLVQLVKIDMHKLSKIMIDYWLTGPNLALPVKTRNTVWMGAV